MSDPSPQPPESADQRARRGVAFGLAAYLWWGFVVVYFKAVASVPPLEVLAHRVVWSVLLLGALLAWRRRLKEATRAFQDRRTAIGLCFTTALIAINWFTFIWAVGHDFVLQASLGYFINPLVNVLMGTVFLGERLRRAQGWAVLIAGLGVLLLALRLGEIPFVSLILAFTFGTYGLLRKTMKVDGLMGLAVETTLLLPVALGYLGGLWASGTLVFGNVDFSTDLLLVASGAVTALPLLWFANAARRLNYATVGLLQYIAPSMQFVLAVAIYGEALEPARAVTFAMIWVALAIYTTDAWRHQRAKVPPPVSRV